MSFEIFLQCFDRGEPAGISGAAVRRLFPVVEAESEDQRWSVRYDEKNALEIHVKFLGADRSQITSMTLLRPCDHPQLWEALLAAMKLGSVTLYFPGDAPPLVASAEAGKQLPPEMIEALGQPRVVAAVGEIVDAVRSA